jgi:hypothetical protein
MSALATNQKDVRLPKNKHELRAALCVMMQSFVVLAAVVVAFAAIVPPAAATPLGEIHLTKVCPTFATTATCTVVTSSSGPIPVGTVATYSIVIFSPRLSAGVVLATPDGSTATGGCTLSFTTGLGTCNFVSGTGSLAGFHANINVTFHFDTGVTNWDGVYFFAS